MLALKVRRLEENKIFKNYKELCKFLNEEERSGKSKKYQLKQWEQYFSFEIRKNKSIKIIEIHYEEKEKIDLRKEGNNSVYKKDIQILLVDLLAQKKGKQALFISCSKLLRELEMVNSNYIKGRNNIATLSEMLEINESEIYEFYNNTQSKLKTTLETALRGLRNRSLIMWNTTVTVCAIDTQININEMDKPKIHIQDDEGQLAFLDYDTNKVHRKATDEEKEKILEIEKETLKELKLFSKQFAFLSGQWDFFKKEVNRKLKQRANILFYYDSYEIVTNDKYIAEEISEINKMETQFRLNNNVVNGLKRQAINNHVKAKKVVKESKIKNLDRYRLKANEKFLDNNETLILATIDLKAKEI